jgi:anthranilate synthase component 2
VIAIVDNYDSFTYNLVHYIEDLSNVQPLVYMNDELDWESLEKCTHIILSPGPGLPQSSGDLMKVLEKFHDHKNILGVCLGMQAIGEFFGGSLKNLEEVQHGVQTNIFIEPFAGNKLYTGISSPMEAGRYHSWVVNKDTLPQNLIVTATDEKGDLMSFQHSTLPIFGIQFHPESIMTEKGKKILSNWLKS